MNAHVFEYRIAYADTDRLGVVYYANYFMLFERGRTELLRSMGHRYKDIEEKWRIFLPVVKAHCDYKAPARYDDLIEIRTTVAELGRTYVVFSYEITEKESSRFLAQGETKHPFLNSDWRPTRIPGPIREALTQAQPPSPRP